MKTNIRPIMNDYVVKYYNDGEDAHEKFLSTLDEAIEVFNHLTDKYDFVKIVNETILFTKTKVNVSVYM